MMQLHQDYSKFVAKNTVIVAIGPDSAKVFRNYWAEEGFLFYGIPDESQHILKLYGQEIKWFKLGRMPAQMLVDQSGRVRYVHYGHSMQDITENNKILDLIDTL